MKNHPQPEPTPEERLMEAARRKLDELGAPEDSELSAASESNPASSAPAGGSSEPGAAASELPALRPPGAPAACDSAPSPDPAASQPWSEAHLSSYLGMEEIAGSMADSIPGYSIMREIHRGGQGVVYQALQKTTRRKVAIKVMREGPFAGKHEKARFEREVQVLASLKHPNIVAIHESGVAGANFYFVMDYISGQPLDVYMAAGQRSVRETLVLFKKVCEAVSAAHLRGIIHRDLKPGNIRIDSEGEPQVLDFGLAKVAPGQVGDESVSMTLTGQFVGSLPWASPEQAEGIPAKIDIRTDVYSLGVILYQILTSKFPYAVVGGFREVQDRIMKAPPVRPRALRGEIDDEVETIVLKSLAKERERRYQSAGELARDIGHYLAGEAIDAKRDSTLYILRKHLKQYRLPLAVGAGFVVMLAVGLLVSLALLRQVSTERDRAISAERQARAAELKATEATEGERKQRVAADQQFAAAALAEGTAEHLAGRPLESRQAFISACKALMKLNQSTLPAEVGLYRSFREFDPPINTLRGHRDGVLAVAWLPDGERACSSSEDGTIRLWDVRTGRELHVFPGHKGIVATIAVSPDGVWLLSAGEDQTIRLWDIKTGHEKEPQIKDAVSMIRGVAFSPDGRYAASTVGDREGVVRLWDVQTGTLFKSLHMPKKEQGYGVAFSPDGNHLLATTYGFHVWIWDLRADKEPMELRGHTMYVASAAFSPDGERVLSASFDKTLLLWDLRRGESRPFRGHTAAVRGAAFLSADRAVSCAMDETVREWNVETGEVIRTFSGHPGGARAVAVLETGNNRPETGSAPFSERSDPVSNHHSDPVSRPRAISGGVDRCVHVWDLRPGAEVRFVPASRHSQTNRPAMAIQPTTGPQAATRPAQLFVTSLSCSGDGLLFATGDSDGWVTLYDLATLRVLKTFPRLATVVESTSFLPDGGNNRWRLFAADTGGSYRVWDLAGAQLRRIDRPVPLDSTRPLRGEGSCFTAVSSDGRLVLTSLLQDRMGPGSAGRLELRSIDSGQVIRTLTGSKAEIRCLAVSPDGRHGLSGDQRGTMYYWDLQTGECLWSQPVGEKTGDVDCVAFSGDGRRALTAGHDNTVRLWDLAGGTATRPAGAGTLPARRPLREFAGSTQQIKSVAFGRGERTVFAVGADRTLWMWDAGTGAPLELGAALPTYGYALAVAPPAPISVDASEPVLVSSGASISLWDVPRGMRHLEFVGPLHEARATLQHDPQNAKALLTLADWYTFRGVDDWAAELLEQARSAGTSISSLALARCYWRLGRLPDAEREFRAAIARQEAPAEYLRLCLAAVGGDSPAAFQTRWKAP